VLDGEKSRQQLLRHVQKLTDAIDISYAEGSLQRDQIAFVTKIYNEAKRRRSKRLSYVHLSHAAFGILIQSAKFCRNPWMNSGRHNSTSTIKIGFLFSGPDDSVSAYSLEAFQQDALTGQ
jgi:hypothetical protein